MDLLSIVASHSPTATLDWNMPLQRKIQSDSFFPIWRSSSSIPTPSDLSLRTHLVKFVLEANV